MVADLVFDTMVDMVFHTALPLLLLDRKAVVNFAQQLENCVTKLLNNILSFKTTNNINFQYFIVNKNI